MKSKVNGRKIAEGVLGSRRSEVLTNLRFADDLLLTATTRADIKHMLAGIVVAARARGLELHPDKTKTLSNVSKRRGRAAKATVRARW